MVKIIKIFSIILIVVILIIFTIIRFTLPDYNKTISSKEINNTIQIYRDDYGMPIVVAENDEDLAFGIGYAMGQDRLFQMDLIRRVIQGRLSEVLGADLISVDKFFLTITAGKSTEEIYQSYPENIKKILIAYSKGINEFIKNNRLPVEFHLLGYKPEEWRPEDSLSVFYYMSYDLNTSFDTDILFYLLTQKFGLEKAKELFPDYIPQRGEILEVAKYQNSNILNHQLLSVLNVINQIKELTGSERTGASNNWVISKEKSLTDTPIVASDMHLGFGLPGIWYEAQLITPEMNVSGLLLPGIPFVVVGANENVAWAFTNVMADDADFYIEQINPETNQYLFLGQNKDLEIQKKVFRYKKDGAVQEETFEIKKTIHGPIINSIYPIKTNEVFSFKWTAYDQYLSAISLYMANRAKNIDDIEKAIEYFKTPGQNWVYADRDGNIGFTAAVGIPIRRGFNGLLPMPGWSGMYEWAGYVPTNMQPRIRNPKTGWIATANNKHSSNYPYTISNYYHHPDRYERIKELLMAKEKLGIEDMKNIQKDIKSLMAMELTPIFLNEISKYDLSSQPDALRMIEELKNWNYETDISSIASSLFHLILQRVLYNVFLPHLGEEYFNQYLKKKFIVINALRIILKKDTSYWFDNPETQEKETKSEIIVQSFLEAIEILKNHSSNLENWQWGEIHKLTYSHPFGKNALLAKIFNRGPYKVPGSISTVNPMSFKINQEIPFNVTDGASERLIMLPGKINESLRIIPTGISGNPFSRFYGSQIEKFLNYEYRSFHLYKPDNKNDFTYKYKLQIMPENK